jgi:hypothetical protein
MVKWLTLLLHIWEVLDQNLGPETGYPDQGFSWFSPVPPGQNCFLPNPFQLIIHYHPFTQHYTVLVNEKAPLIKLQINTIIFQLIF